MKLPDKKYEPKHCKTLAEYARGWNYSLEDAKNIYKMIGDDERTKDVLLKYKESYDLENYRKQPRTQFFKGMFDCIVEIMKLNEVEETRQSFNAMFSESLEALDKLIRQDFATKNKMNDKEYYLYAKAIETYGDTLQKVVAIEELSELIKEICKDLRNNENKKAIIEEIVDVQIMINQLFIIYGIFNKEYEEEYRRKLERLEKRINESNIGLL